MGASEPVKRHKVTVQCKLCYEINVFDSYQSSGTVCKAKYILIEWKGILCKPKKGCFIIYKRSNIGYSILGNGYMARWKYFERCPLIKQGKLAHYF